MFVGGVGEGVDHVVAGDPGEHDAGEQQSGVVVEPVQDLGVGAICQRPVGEVRLSAFVGLGCFEPFQGTLGPFLRLRRHQAGVGQDAANG